MEPSARTLRVALWVAAILASAVFAIAGIGKLDKAMIGRFEEWGYTPGLAIAIGLLELLGAVGLLIPRCSAWAALGLIVIMFGALGTHLLAGEYLAALAPTLMLGLLGLVLFGRATAG
ncbi:MAG: DoxX family protein [Enhygromyxa sp.]